MDWKEILLLCSIGVGLIFGVGDRARDAVHSFFNVVFGEEAEANKHRKVIADKRSSWLSRLVARIMLNREIAITYAFIFLLLTAYVLVKLGSWFKLAWQVLPGNAPK